MTRRSEKMAFFWTSEEVTLSGNIFKIKKDMSHYLYPCYISLKNKDMLQGKKKS
jgi:hypothetical protein